MGGVDDELIPFDSGISEPPGGFRNVFTRCGGRKNGRTSAGRTAVREARDQGEHVHVAGPGGVQCAALEPGDCTLPRWENPPPYTGPVWTW